MRLRRKFVFPLFLLFSVVLIDNCSQNCIALFSLQRKGQVISWELINLNLWSPLQGAATWDLYPPAIPPSGNAQTLQNGKVPRQPQ
jgi:hypothetical protein